MIHGVLELADWVLYDETTFLQGEQNLNRQLFAIPVGQSDYNSHIPYKTFLNTNSLMAGMLDSPCSMVIRRLNVLFLNEDRPLRLFETSAYTKTLVEFSINRKIYWTSPAWQCASPFALFDTPKEEIAMMHEKYGIDWKKVGASFDEHPLEINVQEYFTARVQMMEPPEKTLRCHVYLDGVESRAVM